MSTSRDENPTAPAADFAPASDADADDDPFLRDSVLAQRHYDRAVAEAASGDETDAVVHFLRASKLAEKAREWYLAADACRWCGDIYYSPEPPYDLERAVRLYRRAVAAYEQGGHFEGARALSYRLMSLKMRRGRELGLSRRARLGLWTFWAVAGFGYRPARVLAWAAAIILSYGLLYWAVGGVVEAGGDGRPVRFWDSLYFSGVTFTTVGYGDLLPAPWARLVALTESGVGACMTGFFVAVLVNRLRH